MSFDNPRCLLLLLLLLPSGVLMFFRYHRRRKEADVFAASSPAEESGVPLRNYRFRMIYSDCLFVLSLCFCFIALSGPRWGEELVADFRRGVDVVFALDISRSMNVRDCPSLPGKEGQSSRLERALSVAYELGLNTEGVRLGAAIGKGRGILAFPLSYDAEAFLNFLTGIDGFSLTGAGTNLESLIDASSGAFKENMPGRREIILFSDGETLSGSPEASVNRLRNRGIVLCAAGFGSDEGGTVPLRESFLLASDGSPVISARESGQLRNLAEKSGGIYIDGNRSDAAMLLANYLHSLSADSSLFGHRRESRARFHLFALAALISLILSRLLGFGARKKKYSPVNGALKSGLFLACLVPFLFSSCIPMEGKLFIMEGNLYHSRGLYTDAVSAYLKAMDYPESVPYAEYGLGSAYFSLEENLAALERYKSAEKSLDALPRDQHPELRFRLKYNSGIIYFEQGEYEQAAGSFREALEMDPLRIEAKRNLELSLLSLKAASKPQALPAQPETGRDDSSPENGGPRDGRGSPVLFEYLRAREQDQWESREWVEESGFQGPDY